jgi:hypothetical protein
MLQSLGLVELSGRGAGARWALGERQIFAYPLGSWKALPEMERNGGCQFKEGEKFHAERESTDHCETRLIYTHDFTVVLFSNFCR